VGARPLPGPKSDSEVKTDESKGVSASCGLGPCRTWKTAWKSLRKFVTPELFQRINALKKGHPNINLHMFRQKLVPIATAIRHTTGDNRTAKGAKKAQN
jgi:hypothetical protein